MPLPETPRKAIESSYENSPVNTSENENRPSSLTNSDWSRVSTPNSLEWDPVEAEIACANLKPDIFLRLNDTALKDLS